MEEQPKKIKEEYIVEDVDGVLFVYKVEEFESEGKRYTIKSSYGNAKISTIDLEKDTYFRGESIKGRVNLKDWRGNPLSEGNVVLILKLAYRRTVLQKFEIGQINGVRDFEIKIPSNLHGDFELLCDLFGYANIPAFFTII